MEHATDIFFILSVILHVAAAIVALRMSMTARLRKTWMVLTAVFATTAVIEVLYFLDHHRFDLKHEHSMLFGISSFIISCLLLMGLLSILKNVRQLVEMEAALKKSEQRFRDFGETASDWFWEMDKDLCFTEFSLGTGRVTGIDPNAIVGKCRLDLTNEQKLNVKWQEHLSDLNHRRPFRDFEYVIEIPGHDPVPVSISGKPIFNAAAEFVGYRGTGRSISEQKKAEAALIAAKDTAEAANEAKSEFLSSISHELRTPLNAIIGFTQVLQMRGTEDLSPVHRKSLNQIAESSKNLSDLIGQLLEMGKIEAGEVDITFNDVALGDIIVSGTNTALSVASEHGVKVIDNTKATTLPTVRTDPMRLRQILANLTTNAVKYNRPGGLVTISASVTETNMVRLSVEDTGLGIPTEHIDGVFKRFNRLGRERSNIEGTGVGLAISKTLSELIGADLGFESEEGVGSTFWIDVPISGSGALDQPAATKILQAV